MSTRTKSNTPWFPGLRPVISVVQAGGVNGCDVDRRTPRTPPADQSRRNGITPSRMRGSSTLNVAPSRPIRTTWARCSLMARRLTPYVLSITNRVDEIRDIGDSQLAERAPERPDLRDQAVLEPVALLDLGDEVHEIDGLEMEVPEPRFGRDGAHVPAARHFLEDREHVRKHLVVGMAHGDGCHVLDPRRRGDERAFRGRAGDDTPSRQLCTFALQRAAQCQLQNAARPVDVAHFQI